MWRKKNVTIGPWIAIAYHFPHAVFVWENLALKINSWLLVLWLKSLTLVFLLPAELFEEGKVSGAVNQSHVFEQRENCWGKNIKKRVLKLCSQLLLNQDWIVFFVLPKLFEGEVQKVVNH